MRLGKAARICESGSGPFGIFRLLGAACIGLAFAAQAQDVVTWKAFAQVEMTRSSGRIVPRFSEALAALDQKEVKVQGFMLPLDMGEKHALFILSAVPPTCAFCMPGGPESMIEVIADKPVEFTYEPIVVAGRMAVLENDIVYYRLTGASAVQP